MTPRATMLRSRFGLLRFIAAAFLVLAGVVQPSVGSATLGSITAPIDSSKVDAAFDVSFVSPCPPKGCALLSFGPGDSTRLARCDATAKPGFNACFDVVLMNDVPVGGLQTEITVTGPNNSAEMPGELFHPVSVLVAPHAAGFQVAWSADGSRAK